MLGKLLKYDFKASKIVLPFYGVSLVLSLILFVATRAEIESLSSGMQIATTIIVLLLGLGTILSTVAVVVVSIVVVVLHFGKQTVGAQGPLMFSLPVSADEFLISKLISAIVTLSASIVYVFGVLGLFTLVGIEFSGAPPVDIASIMWQVAATGSGIIFSVLLFYLSVAVSGYITQNRVLGTIAVYIGISFALQVICVIFIIATFVISYLVFPSAEQYISTMSADVNNHVSILMGGSTVACLIGDILLYFTCRHFFTKKLNLP